MPETGGVSSDDGNLVVFSPSEPRMKGSLLVNYTVRRIKRAKTKQNDERFSGHFGASPAVLCKTIQDLQTTTIEAARVESTDFNLDHFLMAMHHLKRHPTDLEREPIFDIDHMKGRNLVWFCVEKI